MMLNTFRSQWGYTDSMTQTKHSMPFFARGTPKYLVLAFVLFFLAAQSVTLEHSHSGDLSKHVDCTLCLKIGSGHDALPSSVITLVIPAVTRRFDPVHETAIVVARVPANSRGPPLLA